MISVHLFNIYKLIINEEKRAEALKSHKIKLLRNKSNDYSSLDKNKDATTMKSSLHCWLPNIKCELKYKI